jgi:heme ABC exporter ATP-binding subunit CcmA
MRFEIRGCQACAEYSFAQSPCSGKVSPSILHRVATVLAQLDNVSRLFGRFPALRKVSVSFEPGRCYVLLGENGAGKSTLLRVLAGLLEPTSGTARIFAGEKPEKITAQRARVGYMSHASMLYDEMTAVENLQYFAALYRGCSCLTPEEALTAVGLDPALNRPVGQYSQGMRQRTSLARVLLPQPDLLLLDEPFSNMDAESAGSMVAMLGQLRKSQRTVVLTTHQRSLAEPLADYFLTLRAGALISNTTGPALEN